MQVDVIASQPHYIDHIAPIWLALDPSERGELIAHQVVREYAEWVGLHSERVRSNDIVLAAGWADIKGNRGWRQRVLMKHGVGQTYVESHPGYAGGTGRGAHVDVFLCPNERVARANSEDGVCHVIGSPYLESLTHLSRCSNPKAVVISHHWNCAVASETMSARRYFAPSVGMLEKAGHVVARHCHPRDVSSEIRLCSSSSTTLIPQFSSVVKMAQVYACDNSSTSFYAAALGILVMLTPPWYRRDVQHGLRFWEYADIGPEATTPEDLPRAVESALTGDYSERIREMIADLFPVVTGAASLAADTLRMI